MSKTRNRHLQWNLAECVHLHMRIGRNWNWNITQFYIRRAVWKVTNFNSAAVPAESKLSCLPGYKKRREIIIIITTNHSKEDSHANMN
jgi:hypothetical protein